MKRWFARLLMFAVAALAVPGVLGIPAASAATTPPITPGVYKIVYSPDQYRYCLQDVGGNGPLFASCIQGDDMEWMKVQAATGGTWKIVNTLDGQNFCLDISVVRFALCQAGSGTQRFDINPSTDGSYKVVWPESGGTNFCLSEWADGFEACSQGDGYQRFTFQVAS
jgi:hypothetical protein